MTNIMFEPLDIWDNPPPITTDQFVSRGIYVITDDGLEKWDPSDTHQFLNDQQQPHMTSDQFVIWLQGFLDATGTSPTLPQVKTIMEKLERVNKRADPSMPLVGPIKRDPGITAQ